MSFAAGSRIGPYDIAALLGEGGMGQVWRAHDTRLQRDVALKVLPPETLADPTARARLLREARLASKLNHPNVCTIYEVGEADGQAFIAMELVEGRPLSDLLTGGGLPATTVLDFGRQLADALAHAHDRGVVHRDLKSNNVIVTPEGRVKVLDFGLAKRLAPEAEGDATTLSRQASLTEAGAIVGTLAYMAPEQLRGQAADARSDIWALGVVLYELAAGQRPFRGTTSFELSSAILKEPAPTLPPGVPAALAAVAGRCLAKEPGERYQRADEVRAALEMAASGQAIAAPPTPRPTRGFSRGLAAAVGGLFLVAVVAAVLLTLDVGGLRARLAGGTPPAAAPAAAPRVITLAILPLENAGGKADQQYFSDGQTKELISAFRRLHPETLLVKAWGSVVRYKQTDKPIDQIARELGVDYVLNGSAQLVSGRAQIFVELIKVADQTQLWGDHYERELAGILMLQNDVAQQVAKALALKLLPAEQARLAGAKTVDPGVYDLCLKGKERLDRLTPPDVDAAEQYFQQALAKAPASATAYWGTAKVWLTRQQYGGAPVLEAGPKARAAALKAVELDDASALAHAALGSVHWLVDFDLPGAEREFRRALELNPSEADLPLYAHVLIILGRPDEAIRQAERAVAMDPLDVYPRSFYAHVLYYARRYDDALAQADQVLRAQPRYTPALSTVFFVKHMKQQYSDVIAAQATYYAEVGLPDVADALKKGYAESGYAEAWRQANAAELAKYGNKPGVAADLGVNYALAGDRARALDWLEKACAERDPNMVYLGVHPFLDPLRGEPRFQALLRKMNLPQ